MTTTIEEQLKYIRRLQNRDFEWNDDSILNDIASTVAAAQKENQAIERLTKENERLLNHAASLTLQLIEIKEELHRWESGQINFMESTNHIVKGLFSINPLQTDIDAFMKMGLPEDSITEQIECIQSMIDDKYNKASIHSLNGLIVRLNLFTELLAERDRLLEENEKLKSQIDEGIFYCNESSKQKNEISRLKNRVLPEKDSEYNSLKEVNKELLGALKRFVDDINCHPSVAAREHYEDIMIQAMSAIAKHSQS